MIVLSMRQKTEWQLIDSSKPHYRKDTEYAHLCIYIVGDGFYAEVHADGSHERIRLSSDGALISKYVYGDRDDAGDQFLVGSPSVWEIDKEIRSIDEMKSFLEEYVSDPIKLKERAEDYNKKCLMKRS